MNNDKYELTFFFFFFFGILKFYDLLIIWGGDEGEKFPFIKMSLKRIT